MQLKEVEKKWQDCQKIIKDVVDFNNYNTWFKELKPIKLQKNKLTIEVPTKFYYEYIEENYIDVLIKSIRRVFGENVELEYSIVVVKKGKYHNTERMRLSSNKYGSIPKNTTKKHIPVQIINPFLIPGIREVEIDPNLNPIYSFDNFVEGNYNKLARLVGYAVAVKPGQTSYNPLFVYGKTGLGKTHLSQAIGLEIKKRHPKKVVLYVEAERFLRQYTDSIMKKTTNDFTNFYQNIDVLIIDDIHFFSGKNKTQDTFFSIFNQLHQSGKQIVMTSDVAPVDLPDMEPRLLSRFKWGLTAELEQPDIETRIKILKKKVDIDGIDIDMNIIEYVCYSMDNIRELQGAYNSLVAHATLNRSPITLDLTKKIIDSFVKSSVRDVSIDYIQKVISDYFGMPLSKIKAKTRKRDVVQVRQIIMYFSKKFTKCSLAMIGEACGGKDHATVLHACKTVDNLYDTNAKYKGDIEALRKKLNF